MNTDEEKLEGVLNPTKHAFPGILPFITPPGSIQVDVADGYQPLFEVLRGALNQAQAGKGKERHANGKPFLQQPIMEIGRMVGPGYNIGQAMKKGQEAMRLPTTERKVAELLGAINYLASAVLLLQEGGKCSTDSSQE